MSNDIKVGDEVTWREGGYKYGKQFIGIVKVLCPYTVVVRLANGDTHYPDRKKVKRVTPAILVSAAQAACDDQAREDAIASLRAAREGYGEAIRNAGAIE